MILYSEMVVLFEEGVNIPPSRDVTAALPEFPVVPRLKYNCAHIFLYQPIYYRCNGWIFVYLTIFYFIFLYLCIFVL